MKRVFLFVLTNIAVLLVLGIVTHVLGVDRWLTMRGINYGMLMAFSAVVGFTGSFISLAISKWMAIRAYDIQIIGSPANSDEAWLSNTVGELAQKARIPKPEVGIYESPEVNAFATGASQRHSLVAVSSAMLGGMRKEEIEGVLAHEISHVANGDMVTMALLQGVLNTFVVFLSRVIGFVIDQAMRRGDDERQPMGGGIGYYIASFLCQIVFSVLASLIVMSFSRQREFRADAGAAALKGKQPMIGALQRLQQISEHGGVLDERSAAVSAFKINNRAGSLFASHPPLEARIAALEKLPS